MSPPLTYPSHHLATRSRGKLGVIWNWTLHRDSNCLYDRTYWPIDATWSKLILGTSFGSQCWTKRWGSKGRVNIYWVGVGIKENLLGCPEWAKHGFAWSLIVALKGSHLVKVYIISHSLRLEKHWLLTLYIYRAPAESAHFMKQWWINLFLGAKGTLKFLCVSACCPDSLLGEMYLLF